MAEKTKKKFTMPHVYVIIMVIILVATVLTWVIPAGTYDFVEVNGKKVVDPASFHYIEQTPVSLWDMFCAIPQGIVKNAHLIACTLLITGAIRIIDSTGALASTIGKFAALCKQKLWIAVPIFMLPFTLLGALGISTQTLAFVPLSLMVGFALGGDAIVGIAMVMVAMNVGFAMGPFATSSTGNAQIIVGLPLFSGAGFRWLCVIPLFIAAALYIIRYIKKVNADPTQSLVYNEPNVVKASEDAALPEVNGRRIAVLVVYILAFAYIIYTSIIGTCTVESLSALFVITGIVCGVVYGYSANEIATLFAEGCKSIVFGAMLIGFGASIGIIITNGNIIYTIVHALCGLLTNMPPVLAANMLNLINTLISIVIVSASGQAAAVMPIMAPTAQVLGLTQQMAVLTFAMGGSMTDIILPTAGGITSACAMAGVPFDKWFKWLAKFFIIEMILGAVFITIGVLINWGAVYG